MTHTNTGAPTQLISQMFHACIEICYLRHRGIEAYETFDSYIILSIVYILDMLLE